MILSFHINWSISRFDTFDHCLILKTFLNLDSRIPHSPGLPSTSITYPSFFFASTFSSHQSLNVVVFQSSVLCPLCFVVVVVVLNLHSLSKSPHQVLGLLIPSICWWFSNLYFHSALSHEIWTHLYLTAYSTPSLRYQIVILNSVKLCTPSVSLSFATSLLCP